MPRKSTKEKKPLMKACGEKCFWVCDGRVLYDLSDLKDALEKMSEDTFCYHVNKDKDDFTKWVEEVLKESELASQFKKAKNRQSFIEKIEARLKKS